MKAENNLFFLMLFCYIIAFNSGDFMDSLDEIIKAYMLIHGHDNNLKLLNLDDNLISFVVKLADIDFSKGNKSLKMLLSERKAISDAKNFMEHYFKLHKVLYANDSDLKKLNGRLIMSIDGLLRLYNKMGKLVNPFDIPVKFVDKDAFYGNLILQTSLSDDEYFLQRMKLFLKKLNLVVNVVILLQFVMFMKLHICN